MPTREHDCEHCRHWTFDPGELSGASNLADTLEALPSLLLATRESRGLSQRAAAKQIGVVFSTISRAEAGEDLNASNAAKILRWLTSTAAGQDGSAR